MNLDYVIRPAGDRREGLDSDGLSLKPLQKACSSFCLPDVDPELFKLSISFNRYLSCHKQGRSNHTQNEFVIST